MARRYRFRRILGCMLGSALAMGVRAGTGGPVPAADLAERPPALGEPIHTRFLGREIHFPGFDRRRLNAWTLGAAISFPTPGDRPVDPAGSLYLWRRPDTNHLLYGDIALVYNHLFHARSLRDGSPFEWVTTFENYTIPKLQQAELIDGQDDEDGETEWGYVRPGIGFGYRRQVGPAVDNLAAADLIVEPGLLYFGDHARRFRPPPDTFELRSRLQLRWDRLRRNLLSLPDRGFAAGADGIWGWRARWRDWGVDRRENGHHHYLSGSGYALAALPVPFAGGRHRLIAAVNAGITHHPDRFNRSVTRRLSGGINPLGMDFHTTGFPTLPGAAYLEFFPRHYAIGYGEYRFAPTFFSFVHLYGGAAHLDPIKYRHGRRQRHNTLMPFAGVRLSTGLPGGLLLVVDYAHNFGLRRGRTGYGNQVTVWVSGMF